VDWLRVDTGGLIAVRWTEGYRRRRRRRATTTTRTRSALCLLPT